MTEQWIYDDANRSVTYSPGAGPLAQSTTTTLSADGSTTTVSVGGMPLYRTQRSAINGALVKITEWNDDSKRQA